MPKLAKVATASVLTIALAAGSATAAIAEGFDYGKRTYTTTPTYYPSAAEVGLKVVAIDASSVSVQWNASAFTPQQQPTTEDGEVTTLFSRGYPGGCTFGIASSSIAPKQPGSSNNGTYLREVHPSSGGLQVTVLDVAPGVASDLSLSCFTHYDRKVVSSEGDTSIDRGWWELPSTYTTGENFIVAPDVAPLTPVLKEGYGYLREADGGHLAFAADIAAAGDSAATTVQYAIYRNGEPFEAASEQLGDDFDGEWWFDENFPTTMAPGEYSVEVRGGNGAGWSPWSATYKIATISPLTKADDGAATAKSAITFKAVVLEKRTLRIKWTSPRVTKAKVTYRRVGTQKALHTQVVGKAARSAAWKSAKLTRKGSYTVSITAYLPGGKVLKQTSVQVKR